MKKYDQNVLPYINNAPAIVATVAAAVISVLIFHIRGTISIYDIIVDACVYGMVTSFINVFIAWFQLKKKYMQGRLPSEIPVSSFMCRLPRNPVLFSLITGVIFAVVVPLCNMVILMFYEKENLDFISFFVWRVAYAIAFSMYIMKVAVYRYVQPGCFKVEVSQHGDEDVSIPIPPASALRKKYNAMIYDFGCNLLLGVIFGSVYVSEGSVIILPVTSSGIWISALILSVIVTAQIVVPTVRDVADCRTDDGSDGEAGIGASLKGRLFGLPQKTAFKYFIPILLIT